jgi:N-acylneuraminate cytidylyltransferase
MSNKVVAIIPARGGSKGIPRKNILEFCGRPLIAWSILQAVNTPEIDAVYVTSDDDEILDIATSYGAQKIKRPDEMSGDTSTSESAIAHALQGIEPAPAIILMLQPTSPLRKPDDLSSAVRQFKTEMWDSGFSGAVLEDFLIWKKNERGILESTNYDYKNRGRRQERKHEYVENGSIYLFKPEILVKNNNRMGGKIGVSLMDFWQSFEIDEPDDWELLETLFKKYLGKYYL